MRHDKSYKNLIFAHRGANKEAIEQGLAVAENSRAAFNHALLTAIDGFETDVQLSRDEVPLLWHDWFLDKLGFPEKRIDDFTFEQLKEFNFANNCSTDAARESVLSLKEFVDTYQKRCQLNIEIKSHNGESAHRQHRKIAQTLAILKPFADKGVFISSFSLSCLQYAHQEIDDFPLVYLLTDNFEQADITRLLKTEPYLKGFCLPIDKLDSSVAELLRENTNTIATYTCNSAEQISKALTFDADIIISDYPQLALQLREQTETKPV